MCRHATPAWLLQWIKLVIAADIGRLRNGRLPYPVSSYDRPRSLDSYDRSQDPDYYGTPYWDRN